MNRGTPKTLNGALENAFAESGYVLTDVFKKTLKNHIKDFISQKFSVAMIKSHIHSYEENDLKKLFEDCTK